MVCLIKTHLSSNHTSSCLQIDIKPKKCHRRAGIRWQGFWLHRISTYPPTNPRSARCSSVSLLQIISLTATSCRIILRNDNFVNFEGCQTKKYLNAGSIYLGFRWITFRRYGQGSEAHVNDGTYFSKRLTVLLKKEKLRCQNDVIQKLQKEGT